MHPRSVLVMFAAVLMAGCVGMPAQRAPEVELARKLRSARKQFEKQAIIPGVEREDIIAVKFVPVEEFAKSESRFVQSVSPECRSIVVAEVRTKTGAYRYPFCTDRKTGLLGAYRLVAGKWERFGYKR